MSKLSLPWGKEKIDLELPAAWRLAGVLEPARLPGVADSRAEAERSLNDPTGLPRLSELAKAGQKIALVMDGGSRPAYMRQAAQAVAHALPQAQYRTLEGQTHAVAAEALAPLLVEFFAGEKTVVRQKIGQEAQK